MRITFVECDPSVICPIHENVIVTFLSYQHYRQEEALLSEEVHILVTSEFNIFGITKFQDFVCSFMS
jgi:hypothetical protein